MIPLNFGEGLGSPADIVLTNIARNCQIMDNDEFYDVGGHSESAYK